MEYHLSHETQQLKRCNSLCVCGPAHSGTLSYLFVYAPTFILRVKQSQNRGESSILTKMVQCADGIDTGNCYDIFRICVPMCAQAHAPWYTCKGQFSLSTWLFR